MPVVSATWTPPVQWGSATAGVWTNIPPADAATGDIQLVLATTTGGAIFDAGVTTALVGGDERVLNGPILMSIQMHAFMLQELAGLFPLNLEIGLVPDPQPADYSNALLPWARSEVSLGVFALTQPLPLVAIPGVNETTLSLPSVTVAANVTGRARWNGRIALSFRVVNGSINIRIKNGPNFPIRLPVTYDQFFSGLAGGPTGPRQRFVRDHRYGIPALNTELVRDGDQTALWVRPWDSDPEDEPARYKPRPGEGSVDDEIGGG